jgi:hypothetical protein
MSIYFFKLDAHIHSFWFLSWVFVCNLLLHQDRLSLRLSLGAVFWKTLQSPLLSRSLATCSRAQQSVLRMSASLGQSWHTALSVHVLQLLALSLHRSAGWTKSVRPSLSQICEPVPGLGLPSWYPYVSCRCSWMYCHITVNACVFKIDVMIHSQHLGALRFVIFVKRWQ